MFGAPPIGCLPSQRTLGGGGLRICAEEYNEAAQLYNSKLISETEYLNSTLAQSRVVFIDIYNPLLSIIENPLQYGTIYTYHFNNGTLVISFIMNIISYASELTVSYIRTRRS